MKKAKEDIHIFQIDETPVLREKAQPVATSEIASARMQKVIADMKKAMHSQEDAVAIAAPQIGESLRIFVVSGKVFVDPEDEETAGEVKKTKPLPPDVVVVNPIISKLSRKKEPMEEGCLSVRWLYGKVNRSEKATIKAYDETGRPFTRGASGLLAQIFQHETDHLDGVIFTDKATDVREVPPEGESTDPK
jgi:peptide deformylase